MCVELGNRESMSDWQELAELLVQLDLQIEDLNGWATEPEDIERLEELEALRTDVRFALTFHHVPRGLRKRLWTRDHRTELARLPSEPRD